MTISVDKKQTRLTRQKKIIYDVLMSTASHPTADWIYNEAKQKIPNLSLGTVYRNLQSLVKDGYAMELNYGKGQSRFDGNPAIHYHFVCDFCGRVFDFTHDAVPVNDEVLCYAPGVVRSHRLECYGICNNCMKQ
jgi:Fe2+ or Zn2+ uptake regulation protein